MNPKHTLQIKIDVASSFESELKMKAESGIEECTQNL